MGVGGGGGRDNNEHISLLTVQFVDRSDIYAIDLQKFLYNTPTHIPPPNYKSYLWLAITSGDCRLSAISSGGYRLLASLCVPLVDL